MGKNKGAGGKKRRKGRRTGMEEKRELTLQEEGQVYAQVLRMLGNARLDAYCFDGKKRQCHIRGKMRKKVWVNQGDVVLVSLREFQDDKGDVILKYNAEEARKLKALGELPDNARINETDNVGGSDVEEECAFVFDDI